MLEVPQRWGCSRSSLTGACDAGSSSKMRLFQKFSQRGWWCWKFLKDVAVLEEFLKGAAAPCTSRKKIKFCSSLRVRLHLFLLSTGAAAPCTPLTLSKLSIFLSLQTALLTLRMMWPSIFRMLRLLLLQDSARSVSTRLPERGWISCESTNSHVFPFQNNRSLSSVKNSQSSSFLTFLSSPRMALSHAIKTSLSLIPKQQPRDPSSKMLSFFLLSMNYPLSCIHHRLSIYFFFFWCLLPSFFRPLACVFPSKTHFSSRNEFFFLFRFFLFSALPSRLPSLKRPLLWPTSPCLFYAHWEIFFYTTLIPSTYTLDSSFSLTQQLW